MTLHSEGNNRILMFAGGIVANHRWSCGSCNCRLAHFAAPELENFFGIRQSTTAKSTAADRHHPLTNERIGQRFVVSWPKSLKAQPTRMISPRPFLERQFGRLKALALDDGHLPPIAIQPNVPGNMPRRT